MSLYLLHASDSEYFLFNCYGLFKIGEHDIARYVSQFHRFQNIVTLIAVYKFEAQTQKKAFSKGRVTDELRSFLLLNLPEAKADFSLGVESPKLGSRIFRVTNMACICDKFVLELLRGVQLHIITFTEFPEPCNLDEATTETLVREREDLPLLKYEFDGCVVEDMKKGRTRTHVATLMDMVSIHDIVRRMKDDKILLDTTLKDPVKFCLGAGQMIPALDIGICGMFVHGERRFIVPPKKGYETKCGRGTRGFKGPKGAPGHMLIIGVTLVAVDF